MQRVLPAGRVQHQQHLVRAVRHLALDDAIDLAHLLHQVDLRVQPPGRIDDEHVDVTTLGGGEGVEHHSGGVAALLVGDHVHPGPLTPLLELFDRRRAERVGGGQQHLPALPLISVGQLADAGRLAGAVHTHHQDDGRLR